MRPRRQWWAEEAEWLAARLDRWLAACQGLSHGLGGLGQGYSKLHTDRDRPRPARARSAPAAKAGASENAGVATPKTGTSALPKSSALRACAQRLQSIARGGSRSAATPVTPTHSVTSTASSRLRRRPAQQQQRPADPVAPTAIVFEKCRPRRSGASSPSLPAVDIVYYPFRVENCVVCRQLGAAAAGGAGGGSAAALTAAPCPREGCCAPYVPTPQQQASGASGALLFRGQSPTPSLDDTPVRLPPPPPRPHCGEREPVISMSQDYIEVRYDRPPPTPTPTPTLTPTPSPTPTRAASPEAADEQPPPSYQAAMRGAAFDQHDLGVGDSVIGDLALFSPRIARAPAPRYPYDLGDEDEDADEDTIYSRDSVAAVLEREMASWRPPPPRPRPHYRSRGRFSSVMYETQRMFEEAFHVATEEVPLAVRLPPRGHGRHVSSAQGPAMGRAWSVHGVGSLGPLGPVSGLGLHHQGLREVDMPHHGFHHGLRSLLSVRRPKAKSQAGQVGQACCRNAAAAAAFKTGPGPVQATGGGGGRTSARPQKKVVVGERGLRGPVWPRVILTFDRGVTPYQTRAQ